MKTIRIGDNDLFDLARNLRPGCNPTGWRMCGNVLEVVCSEDEPPSAPDPEEEEDEEEEE